MKIESGKLYRTRDGRKAFAVYSIRCGTMFAAPEGIAAIYAYEPDGSYKKTPVDHEGPHDLDLISEWTDEQEDKDPVVAAYEAWCRLQPDPPNSTLFEEGRTIHWAGWTPGENKLELTISPKHSDDLLKFELSPIQAISMADSLIGCALKILEQSEVES